MTSELETYLVDLIAKSAKVEPDTLDPDADLFMDLGIDSLEGLKILAQVEKRFGVTLPDHELMHLHTLRKIREAIQQTQAN
jgi:acyl carrier protein